MKQGFSIYVRAAAILQAALLVSCGQGGEINRPVGGSGAQDNGTQAKEAQASAAQSAAPVSVKGPERLVLAFGDSLYAGYGLKRGESMPAHVETLLRQQGLNAKIVNAGVSGDTTSAGLKRLAFTLDKLPRKPDLVLLGLGGNDVLRQIPLAETRTNLVAMLQELRRRDIPVVLTGMLAPPNLGPDYADSFNTMYPQLAKQYRAALDPFILAGVLGDRRLMLPDGLHPNAKGIDIMAARIAPIVARQLQES